MKKYETLTENERKLIREQLQELLCCLIIQAKFSSVKSAKELSKRFIEIQRICGEEKNTFKEKYNFLADQIYEVKK